ncbi:hypothetical protein AB1Y20_005442 [Prymnesium parvum]|uniref:Ubiquitin-like protein ATG12 n=1 Tax=Prymnesium parvum TaxID=97485 RepID=A0AB34J4N1_PRYPA
MAPPVIRDDDKVVVQFNHTGSAPILKQNKYKFPASTRFLTIASQLRAQLGLPQEEALFLYCKQSFAPPLDARLGDIALCFHVDGVLILNYCQTPAWG